ncbi:hypothetical protein CNY89_00965 [Amaricoccus sp. HAR-UPW-R2A-40]|nr:hypothetical protein CNY89_00965 [Amaricoccus sp. HAR-UPW-R2A-40]
MVDLLALDAMNPRAVLYHLSEVQKHVAVLPGAEEESGQMSPLSRAVLRAHAGLAVQEPETLDTVALGALAEEISGLSELISDTYLR